MSKWTLGEIALAVKASNEMGNWKEIKIDGVAFNTQDILPGMLFVPLKGNRDGHDFVDEAIRKGASAALWSEEAPAAPNGFPVVIVKDPLEALQQFAKTYLKKVNPQVVGITGSNGKTTTKDMTDAVLSATYKTYKTQGNFNNDIGLPMTILQMPEDTEVVILEMGMSAEGEIRKLSELAEPDIAVITMIGESHIEFFGSRSGIADAKMEIMSGLKSEGVLIFPGDEPLLEERTSMIPTENKQTFGHTSPFDAYPLNVQSEMRETHFRTNLAPEVDIVLPIPGTYNVQNALAALLVGRIMGISVQQSAQKLAYFHLTKNRIEWLEGMNGSYLLNDAYNASPTSMKAVLKDFSSFHVKGRKRVVLGDIRELGNLSQTLHRSIHEALSPELLDEVVLYGTEMGALNEELLHLFPTEKLRYFPDNKDALIDYLKQTIRPDDHVLIKSSFGTGLLDVSKALKANN